MNTIQHYNNQPTFKARIALNDCTPLIKTSIKGKSCADVMFHENMAIKCLNNISIKITKNILNKRLKKPKNNFERKLKQTAYKIVKFSRIIGNKIFILSNKKSINKLGREINPNSTEYIEEIAKIGNSIDKKFINMNVENNPLERISDSKNATIFVLNHPNYHKDKFSYVIINSLLNKFYVAKNKQAECPRPKILVSKNMLDIVGEKVGKIYLKFGMTPVDASIKNRNTKENAAPMLKLLKEFINNKSNIFIFPEGNYSLAQNMPLEKRIQPGIAGFIKKAINNKKSVRVVPIGLKYTDEKNSLGNIFVGKPMYFKKSGNDMVYTEGTDKKKISHVNLKDSVSVIFKEICENIKYGMQQADNLN
ncbi:MAG: lysophospholipid acyltransferase family protein [Candidatus Gastranaerophilaceae bacterium]